MPTFVSNIFLNSKRHVPRGSFGISGYALGVTGTFCGLIYIPGISRSLHHAMYIYVKHV